MKKRYLVLLAALMPLLGGCPWDAAEPDRTPATITLNPAGPLTLVSGGSQQFEAVVANKSGEPLTGVAVTYASSAPNVLSNSNGGATFAAAKAGSATVTATVEGTPSVTATATVTVTAGAASKLGVKTQPGGAVSGQALSPQPAVEIQDAAGNVVTSSTASVTVAIASGGGTLNGTATVAAVSGVATFTNLAIRGQAGARTLTFSSTNLTATTSAALTLVNDPTAVALGVSPSSAQSVAAGGTVTLTGTLKNADSAVVSGTVTWATKDATIATISASGVVTGVKVGSTKVLAKSGNLASDSVTINVTPGPAAKLRIRTQPGAATPGAVLATQPVVEVTDANNNIVTGSTLAVNASKASGPGGLGGTTTVTAANGVATYTNLFFTAEGNYTIQFTSAGLTSVTSNTVTISAAPAQIALSTNALSFGAPVGGAATAPQTVNVTNSGGGTLESLNATITYGSGSGWLTASLSSTSAPATLTVTATPGALAAGQYTATITLSSSNAANAPTIAVTFTVGNFAAKIRFGEENAKIVRLDVAGTTTPTKTAFNAGGGTITGVNYTFESRAPAIATVSASGVITGAAAGETFVIATAEAGARDSVYIQVLPATGPVLYADLGKMNFKSGDALTVKLYLDMRGATLGAANISIAYPGDFFTGFLNYGNYTQGAAAMAFQVAVTGTGTLGATGAAADGRTGVVELVSLTFTVPSGRTPPRYGFFTLLPLDVTALDYSSLTASVVRLRYPMILVP